MSTIRLSAGSGLLAAFAAAASWLCCLPVALGVLGASGSVLAAFLGPLRPYIGIASLASIALGFVQAYGRGSGAACAGDACRRPDRLRRQRCFLWLAAVLAAILLTVPYWLDWVIYWSL